MHTPSVARRRATSSRSTAAAIVATSRAAIDRVLPRGAIVLTVLSFAYFAMGVVRNRVFANTYGAGAELDAYNAAFRIPEIALDVLVAAGLTAPFVPIFTRLRHDRPDDGDANGFGRTVLTGAIAVMTIASIAIFLAAPWLAGVIGGGFDAATQDLYVQLLRINCLAQMLFAANLSGLWLVLLGWFLVSAATAESSAVRVNSALAGLTVRDIMTPDPVCVYAGLPVDAFVTTAAASARHRAFPVIDLDGRAVGVVRLGQLAAVPPASRRVRRIGEVATPTGPSTTLAPDEPASAAALALTPATPFALVVESGHVVGVVSAVDLARAVDLVRLKSTAGDPA